MKVLEAQSATLTNYEVYTHLLEQRARYEKRGRRRGPGNLETLVKEMLEYFRTAPSPLRHTPVPYNDTTIRTLLERLRPYDLTKAEIIMIMNHRPTDVAALNTVVEELEDRFPDHATQHAIVEAIVGVLGRPNGQAERKAMEDVALDARLKDDGRAQWNDEMLVDET